MDKKSKLINEWKQLRASYFLKYEEDLEKFKKLHSHDPLYSSVAKHLDKSFREINQIAESEIDMLLENQK